MTKESKCCQLLEKNLSRLSRFSFMITGLEHQDILKVYINFFKETEKHCGTLYAIKELKAIYSEATRYAVDDYKCLPLTQKFYKRDADGFISHLRIIKLAIKKGNVNQVRMVLTLLRSFESLTVEPSSDISTLVNHTGGTEGYKSFRNNIIRFLTVSCFGDFIKYNYTKYMEESISKGFKMHYTTKSGISGGAISNIGMQSLAFKDDLYDQVTELGETLQKGFKSLFDRTRKLYKDRTTDLDLKEYTNENILLNSHVKIVNLRDKGPKTRIVAIGNYWLQQSFKPIHSTIMSILKLIPQDGTHRQETQFERVMAIAKVKPVWSFDMTAATDLWTRLFLFDLLFHMCNIVAKLWFKIIENITVTFKGKEIKYAEGQPMGLWVSWPLFALCHHCLIQYIWWTFGNNNWFEDYSIIGDDVAIWDQFVAEEYYRIITKVLKIPINLNKSFIPRSLTGPCNAEFAKRICKRGIEITGISPGLIIETKTIWEIPEMFNFLAKHNLLEPVTHLTVASIMKFLGDESLKRSKMLLWALHINSLVGGPVLQAVLSSGEEVNKVTLNDVFKARYQLLVQSQIDLSEAGFGIQKEQFRSLAKILNIRMPTDLAITRIFYDLVADQMELGDRMKKLFNIELSFINGKVDIGQPLNPDDIITKKIIETPSENSELKFLNEIEYMPVITLDEVLRGKTNHSNRTKAKGYFIKKLYETLESKQHLDVSNGA